METEPSTDVAIADPRPRQEHRSVHRPRRKDHEFRSDSQPVRDAVRAAYHSHDPGGTSPLHQHPVDVAPGYQLRPRRDGV